MAEKKNAADVANEKLEQIRKDKASKNEGAAFAEAERIKAERIKKEEEARGASKVTPPKKEKTKDELEAEAQKNKEAVRQKAETEAAENVKLLNTPDEKLDGEQQKKKATLKDQSKQEKIDKRIGELYSDIQKMKGAKEVDTNKIVELEQKVKELETEKNPDKEAKAKAAIEAAKQDRINKVAEEDKEKSPEERREMSDEAFNDWLMEDYAKASTWLTKREIRRDKESEADKKRMSLSKAQVESYGRARKMLPKLDSKALVERAKELKEAGKSNEEIGKTLSEEMPESALAVLITKEHPEWDDKPNAPELVVAEVVKRMKSKDAAPEKSEDVKRLEKELEEANAALAEIERQKNADGDIRSSRRGKPMSTEKKTELEEAQDRVRAKAGISVERLKKTLERRKKIPGASKMTKEHHEEE